jgi:hypothetical protein
VATFNTGSSEFPSTLAAAAKVNAGAIKFQWARDKASATELQGVLAVVNANTHKPVGTVPLAIISAGESTTNIDFTFPGDATPGHYNAEIHASLKQISNRVALTFDGGGSNNADVTATGGSAAAPGSVATSYAIKLSKFAPGSGDTPPKLYYRVQTSAPVKAGSMTFEVYSQPFTNTQNLTQGSGEHGPIRLFKGTVAGVNATANSTKHHLVHLKKTLDSVGNEDWSIANSNTKNATIKWSGAASGEEEKPLHSAW